jgi:hypothetical protein
VITLQNLINKLKQSHKSATRKHDIVLGPWTTELISSVNFLSSILIGNFIILIDYSNAISRFCVLVVVLKAKPPKITQLR